MTRRLCRPLEFTSKARMQARSASAPALEPKNHPTSVISTANRESHAHHPITFALTEHVVPTQSSSNDGPHSFRSHSARTDQAYPTSDRRFLHSFSFLLPL
ncbi:uncharacterized protein BDZ83DRAFT_604744, partial [Colletotrichum acutatum]